MIRMLNIFALKMQNTSRIDTESTTGLIRNVPPSLLELSRDLGALYEMSINFDMKIVIPGCTFMCHRSILSARSKSFDKWIDCTKSQKFASFEFEETRKVMDAVLVYMYTGNLCLVESLKVPLFDLHQAASYFKLYRLKELLDILIIPKKKQRIEKSYEYFYKINVTELHSYRRESNSGDFIEHVLDDFTLEDDDEWYLTLRPMYCGKEKTLGIYMYRITDHYDIVYYEYPAHIVNFEMHILDVCENKHYSFSDVCIFKNRDEIKRMGEFIFLKKLQVNAEIVLPHDVLSLSCKFTITQIDMLSQLYPVFEIKHQFEKYVIREFYALSHDMHELLKSEKFCNISIFIKGAPILKANSTILYIRTLIPTPLNGKLMDLGNFGISVWKSFIYYLYTGRTLYLQDHMRELYVAAFRLQLRKMQNMYSRILANHLTVCNVFEVLSYAKAFDDTDLIKRGLLFIAENNITENVM